MTKINISKKETESGWDLTVIVLDENSQTEHLVHLSKEVFEKLAPNSTPELLVEKSFQFLLEREPKESILGEFDLQLIGKYFPEYEEEIKDKV